MIRGRRILSTLCISIRTHTSVDQWVEPGQNKLTPKFSSCSLICFFHIFFHVDVIVKCLNHWIMQICRYYLALYKINIIRYISHVAKCFLLAVTVDEPSNVFFKIRFIIVYSLNISSWSQHHLIFFVVVYIKISLIYRWLNILLTTRVGNRNLVPN